VTEPDVLGCADEPIRIPGAVQPHGALVAADDDPVVVLHSANADEVLGRSVAGAAVADLLDLAAVEPGLPLRTTLGDRAFEVAVHRTDGLLVTEWEPLEQAHAAGEVWHRRLPLVLQRLQEAPDLNALGAALAREVRWLTGFDRVMVYRFDPDWNGEVVAEERREDLEPFLGLRYPASDIPAQARALYRRNWLRLIPDARYTPVPLVPERNPVDGRPLDLGASTLRSVSPVHLEYLANMGVVASMSVSLLDEDRLWGLIACHHYAGPHRPTPATGLPRSSSAAQRPCSCPRRSTAATPPASSGSLSARPGSSRPWDAPPAGPRQRSSTRGCRTSCPQPAQPCGSTAGSCCSAAPRPPRRSRRCSTASRTGPRRPTPCSPSSRTASTWCRRPVASWPCRCPAAGGSRGSGRRRCARCGGAATPRSRSSSTTASALA
jgi:hypothetical protein